MNCFDARQSCVAFESRSANPYFRFLVDLAAFQTGPTIPLASKVDPILFALLENRSNFDGAILMMQKEVAQRLVAEPSSKEYGILSVQTQLMSSPELLFDVSPNSFSPPPKVMSSVIQLTFNRPSLPCSDKTLKSVVRTAFNQRRKKLSNSLKPVLGDKIPDGFNYDQRAEDWSPDIYAELSALLEH